MATPTKKPRAAKTGTPKAGKTTRAGGVGSKFPRASLNMVNGSVISSASRVAASEGRGRASARKSRAQDETRDDAPLAGSFGDAFALAQDDVADDTEDTEEMDDGDERDDDGALMRPFAWPELPTTAYGAKKSRAVSDEDGEETSSIARLVTSAEEDRERARYKGVTVDHEGNRTLRGDMQWVPIAQLIPAIYNPRSISPAEMASLKASIEEFGMPEPVVVNRFPGRENIIVGGHQRTEAARQLGWEEVPVTWVYLNQQREQQLNLALNKISGTWDEQALAKVMADLDEAGADLTLTGFSTEEVDELLAAYGDLDASIDLGTEFDSEKHRADGAAQIIVLIPAEDYDDLIGETIRAAVDALRARFPRIAIQTKGGA